MNCFDALPGITQSHTLLASGRIFFVSEKNGLVVWGWGFGFFFLEKYVSHKLPISIVSELLPDFHARCLCKACIHPDLFPFLVLNSEEVDLCSSRV